VNTTRVNAADITSRVAALQSDNERSHLGKAGFAEEFEVDLSVSCCHFVVFLTFSKSSRGHTLGVDSVVPYCK